MTQMFPAKIQLPWHSPRIAVLEIHGAIGMQVRGPEMVRTTRLKERPTLSRIYDWRTGKLEPGSAREPMAMS